MMNLSNAYNLLSQLGQLDYPVARDSSGQLITAREMIRSNLSLEVLETDWELLKTRMEMKYRDNKLETIAILTDGSKWTPESQIE